MANKQIILLGNPDSGKSNYIAGIWKQICEGGCKLSRAAKAPDDIEYVEGLVAHLNQGAFAPRSEKTLEEGKHELLLPVAVGAKGKRQEFDIVVPDVGGEIWKAAVETTEIPKKWMERMQCASGALLFIRVLSDLNVTPIDWVVSAQLLQSSDLEPSSFDKVPTQVSLCEMLRFLEYTLVPSSLGKPPKVALMVTAWDRLDPETSKNGPISFITKQYPLLSGKLAHISKLEIRVFGVSIVGGDLKNDQEFKNLYFEGQKRGYVIRETDTGWINDGDLTFPVAWLIEDDGST